MGPPAQSGVEPTFAEIREPGPAIGGANRDGRTAETGLVGGATEFPAQGRSPAVPAVPRDLKIILASNQLI